MKKFFTILFFVAMVVSAQSWKQATEATYGPLNKLFFVNANLGWAVGSKATVIKTTDGGETWTTPASEMPVTNSLYSVYFINENVGFAGGSQDVILKTLDGGASWGKLKFEGTGGYVRAIYFSDENTGWVLSSTSSSAIVAKTTNGGASWTTVLTHNGGDIEDMAFYSEGKGICAGGGGGVLSIYYTTDGDNWNKGTLSGLPPVYTRTDLRGIYMTSETVGHIVGWGSAAAGLQPSIHAKTTDGGATWTYETQAEENRTYVNLWSVTFKDENNGIAVGGGSYEGSLAVRTTDGGVNWNIIDPPFGFTLKSIFSIGDKVWICGSGGGLAYSTDFGDSWKLVTPMPSTSFYTIDYAGNTIFAAGFNGLVAKSTDNGATWTSSYASVDKHCPTIQGLFFLNSQVGYAARNNRMVTKTTNGGKTWTKIFPDTSWTSAVNYGTYFVNENVGFVVGKLGTGTSAFYKTTDGGNTWTKKVGTFADHLKTVYFFDENNGIVGGRNMVLAYTTDGGETWTNPTVNNLPSAYSDADVQQIKFLNNQFGLAAAEALLKTTDGGKTWDYVSISIQEKNIKSVVIVDENKWYVVGSLFVFKTEDGGQTWTDVTSPEDFQTKLVYNSTLDGKGNMWISAGSSQLYVSDKPVPVEKESAPVVKSYFLDQNYPNPFGEAVPSGQLSTTIRFGLKKPGHVTLKIYDALGRNHFTLINKFLNLGVYNINFDASGLSSGIYYYSMSVNNVTLTKKMILIK